MRPSNFREVHWFTNISRLCLCLAVVGIITFGAAESAAAASTTGSPPVIKAFSAEPLTLKDGGSALYMFEVWDATKIQLIEAGNIIKEINGPPATNYKGKATGRTTYQIRTGGSNTFDTILLASNASGNQEKKLTLSFETKLQPRTTSLIPPVTDDQTKARTPKWGPQTSASAPLTPLTTSPASNWPPQFAKCPTGCDHCLKPDEAASRGFTQKCLEQPCYYSPDDQQKWYCYREPEKGWCCKDGKVGETTKEQCAQMGGTLYANQAQAMERCQPVGWCCAGGRVGEATQSQCAQLGGALYANQAQAIQACQPVGWCCKDGKVYQATKEQCAQMGGITWYATQAEAIRACQQPPTTYWCCRNGQVIQTTTPGTGCYTTQAEAMRACQPPPVTYWCCRNGVLYQSTTPGAGCYTNQAEAQKNCIRVTPPPLK